MMMARPSQEHSNKSKPELGSNRFSKKMGNRVRLQVGAFVSEVAKDGMHAKQRQSMETILHGTLEAGRLSITAIARGLGEIKGENSKHHVKKVDRFIGNTKIDDHDLQARWTRHTISGLERVVVALDWTDFDADKQATVALSVIGHKGRATPVIWQSVDKRKLKGQRNQLETQVIERFHQALPEGIEVILLADRGFGDVERYAQLENLGFYYVIRFRQNIQMALEGEDNLCPAKNYVSKNGRTRIYRNVELTGARFKADAVVVVQQKSMKEPWMLAAHLPSDFKKAATIRNLYAKRFRIEETFRDLKDPRFGIGFSTVKVSTPARRDRFLLLQAMAHALLEMLGQASENIGLGTALHANTSKKRQFSLFTQGQYWIRAIWNRREEEEHDMLAEFGRLVQNNEFFRSVFAEVK